MGTDDYANELAYIKRMAGDSSYQQLEESGLLKIVAILLWGYGRQEAFRVKDAAIDNIKNIQI